MKLVAIACARNEADIIEAFVRHTGAFCDQIILVDHGSSDATPDILRSLQREGLPLHVISDPTIGNLQTAHMNQMLRLAANDFGGDWIVCLDADEFLQGSLRIALKESGELQCAKVPLRNYYVHQSDSQDIQNPVQRLTHREVHGLSDMDWTHCKVIVPGELARRDHGFVEQGNHRFLLDGFEAGERKLENVWLAHFSIRSPSQYASKLVSKTIQKYRHTSERTHNEDFYEKPFREMRDHYSAFARDFLNTRLSWGSPDAELDKLIRDPIDYKGGPLRYTPDLIDTDEFIKQTLDLTESLARSGTSTSDAVSTGSAAEATTVSVSVSDDPNAKRANIQTFKAAQPHFVPLVFALPELPKNGQIHISVSSGPGMLEISRISLVSPNSPEIHQIFDGDMLKQMVTSVDLGISVPSSGVMRIFISQLPMRFMFEDWVYPQKNAPVELTLLARFVSDSRILASTILAPNVVGYLSFRSFKPGSSRRRRWWRRKSFIGKKIRFDSSGGASSFAATGWSPNEPWGTWSQGRSAVLVFRFQRPAKRELVLQVCACMLFGERHKEMRVRVSANGNHLTTWTINSSKFRWFYASIPATALSVPKLTVLFEIDKPISPAALGLSSDTRELGLGIKCFSIVTPSGFMLRRLLHAPFRRTSDSGSLTPAAGP